MADKLTTWLTSDEYAEIEGISRVAAVKRLKSGKVPGAEQVTTGKRLVWRIPATYKRQHSAWDETHLGWQKATSTGLLTGRPISSKTMAIMEYGLGLFWQALGKSASAQLVTPAHLMQAYATFEVDAEAHSLGGFYKSG